VTIFGEISGARVRHGQVGQRKKAVSSLHVAIKRSNSSRSGLARAKARAEGLETNKVSWEEAVYWKAGVTPWGLKRLVLGRLFDNI
jgi:hypothetical protein